MNRTEYLIECQGNLQWGWAMPWPHLFQSMTTLKINSWIGHYTPCSAWPKTHKSLIRPHENMTNSANVLCNNCNICEDPTHWRCFHRHRCNPGQNWRATLMGHSQESNTANNESRWKSWTGGLAGADLTTDVNEHSKGGRADGAAEGDPATRATWSPLRDKGIHSRKGSIVTREHKHVVILDLRAKHSQAQQKRRRCCVWWAAPYVGRSHVSVRAREDVSAEACCLGLKLVAAQSLNF